MYKIQGANAPYPPLQMLYGLTVYFFTEVLKNVLFDRTLTIFKLTQMELCVCPADHLQDKCKRLWNMQCLLNRSFVEQFI